MELLLNFLSSIPDTVWAALLASCITLGGVFLTNKHSSKEHDKQLDHDSILRREEREMALRRDIYLLAIESLTRSYSAIARLANLDLDSEQIGSEIAGSPGAVAKMQIVANNNTVQIISELSLKLAEISFDLLIQRSKLIDRKNQIDLITEYLGKSQSSQNESLELMKNLNLQGNTDKRLWDQVNKNFEFDKGQSDNYSNKKAELWKQQNEEHAEYFSLCMNRLNEVSDLYPQAILAIREELNLPIDRELFIQNHRIYAEKTKKVVSDFIDSAKEIMNA